MLLIWRLYRKKIRTATILKSPFSYLNLPFENGLGIGERKFHPISQTFQYLWTCPSCKTEHGLVVPKRAEGELEYPIAWMCSAIIRRTLGSAGVSHLADGAMSCGTPNVLNVHQSLRHSLLQIKKDFFPWTVWKEFCAFLRPWYCIIAILQSSSTPLSLVFGQGGNKRAG